jgi:hypothetical protein
VDGNAAALHRDRRSPPTVPHQTISVVLGAFAPASDVGSRNDKVLAVVASALLAVGEVPRVNSTRPGRVAGKLLCSGWQPLGRNGVTAPSLTLAALERTPRICDASDYRSLL